MQWAEDGSMETVPVLADPNGGVWAAYEQDFYIPTTVILGPDMTVLSVDEMVTDPGSYID